MPTTGLSSPAMAYGAVPSVRTIAPVDLEHDALERPGHARPDAVLLAAREVDRRPLRQRPDVLVRRRVDQRQPGHAKRRRGGRSRSWSRRGGRGWRRGRRRGRRRAAVGGRERRRERRPGDPLAAQLAERGDRQRVRPERDRPRVAVRPGGLAGDRVRGRRLGPHDHPVHLEHRAGKRAGLGPDGVLLAAGQVDRLVAPERRDHHVRRRVVQVHPAERRPGRGGRRRGWSGRRGRGRRRRSGWAATRWPA